LEKAVVVVLTALVNALFISGAVALGLVIHDRFLSYNSGLAEINQKMDGLRESVDRFHTAFLRYQSRCESVAKAYSLLLRVSEAYEAAYSLEDFIRRLDNLLNEAKMTSGDELYGIVVYELSQGVEKLSRGEYFSVGYHFLRAWNAVLLKATELDCNLS
jgi:hypothetical protein